MNKECSRLSKNKTIADSIKKTRARRSIQICKSRELKIQGNKLNSTQAEHLRLLFIEAKWFYNYILSDSSNRTRASVKLKSVPVKLPSGEYENREIKYLTSQMKQSIIDNMNISIKSLAKLRDSGTQHVGKLRFKSEISTIELIQYGITYRLDFARKLVYVQGLKKGIRVKGLEQIVELKERYGEVDITTAKLINRPDGIYIKVACFVVDDKQRIDEVLGVDMGVGKHITLSNRLHFRFKIDETRRLKDLQRKLSLKRGYKKGEKKSNKFIKLKNKINKETQMITNKRNNVINQIISLIDEYRYIAFQDEQIAGWVKPKNKNRNKEIYHTGLGAIKSRLKVIGSSRIDILDKFKATTKTCSSCLKQKTIGEKERIYFCESCGLTMDRDLNSTFNMIYMSKFSDKTVSTEHRNLSPRHRLRIKVRNIKRIPYLKVGSIGEARLLVAE